MHSLIFKYRLVYNRLLNIKFMLVDANYISKINIKKKTKNNNF